MPYAKIRSGVEVEQVVECTAVNVQDDGFVQLMEADGSDDALYVPRRYVFGYSRDEELMPPSGDTSW